MFFSYSEIRTANAFVSSGRVVDSKRCWHSSTAVESPKPYSVGCRTLREAAGPHHYPHHGGTRDMKQLICLPEIAANKGFKVGGRTPSCVMKGTRDE